MRLTIALLSILGGSAVYALDARDTAAGYPLRAEAPDFDAGVEYMVRTFIAEGETFVIDDYLVVEVGVFPRPIARVDLRRFQLRINGKTILLSQTPGMVAASLKYNDWTARPAIQASAGTPDGRGIIIGGPRRSQRFPGDPTVNPPRRDIETGTDPRPEKPPVDYSELVQRASLPEGKTNKPVAGFVFFPYNGKLDKIRSVELLIDDAVLKLR